MSSSIGSRKQSVQLRRRWITTRRGSTRWEISHGRYSLSGNLARADAVANQVVDLHPNAPLAWLVRAHVSALAGQPVPEVPAAVAEDPEFRKEWVRVCLVCGHTRDAQEVSGSPDCRG